MADKCCQSWGYTRCILVLWAEQTEFGVCAHVCFVGATLMPVNPLVAEHGTYNAILASMQLHMNVA
eukprot:707703-Pelagomonas_calceolata.AAC.1